MTNQLPKNNAVSAKYRSAGLFPDRASAKTTCAMNLMLTCPPCFPSDMSLKLRKLPFELLELRRKLRVIFRLSRIRVWFRRNRKNQILGAKDRMTLRYRNRLVWATFLRKIQRKNVTYIFHHQWLQLLILVFTLPWGKKWPQPTIPKMNLKITQIWWD